MIPENEKRHIQAYLKRIAAPVALRTVYTGDERSGAIRQFGRAMQSIGNGIAYKEIEGEDTQAPSIELAPNIHYAGVPSANELQPFLRMLSASSVAPPTLPHELSGAVETISLPAKMELYLTPLCHHCPKLVDALFPIAWANPNIDFTIIDAQMFNQRTEAAGIKSVPTLIIDGIFRSTGTIDIREAVAYLQSRKPSSLGSAALESMLSEGEAIRLAQLMAAEEELFPAFLEVLTHAKWPVRLGAMVALEELARISAKLAAAAVDQLWERFELVSDQVKGDILFAIGESGGPETASLLSSVEKGGHAPEVCEAAIDALKGLQKRFSD